jgi:hypothetical protein
MGISVYSNVSMQRGWNTTLWAIQDWKLDNDFNAYSHLISTKILNITEQWLMLKQCKNISVFSPQMQWIPSLFATLLLYWVSASSNKMWHYSLLSGHRYPSLLYSRGLPYKHIEYEIQYDAYPKTKINPPKKRGGGQDLGYVLIFCNPFENPGGYYRGCLLWKCPSNVNSCELDWPLNVSDLRETP